MLLSAPHQPVLMCTPVLRLWVVLGLTLLTSAPLFAQPSHYPDHEQWYNWTDDGHQQYVYEMGRAAAPGDTVVVIHGGWGAEHSYLLDPMAPLADRYRFVLYDQRGSLRSSAPDSTISLDRFVADLEDLRRALGLDRMTLAAHSMGNALAYAYLAEHPDRVRGLVLIAPVPPALFGNGPNMEFIHEVWPEADADALIADREAFFEGWGARATALLDQAGLVPDSLRGASPEAIIQRLTDKNRTRAWRITFTAVNSCTGERWPEMRGGQVFYNQRVANQMMSDPSYADQAAGFWPALQAFEGPVRALIGTCDYVDVGPAVWPHIAERLPNGTLTVVDGAGHSLWMDRPDGFSDALATALQDATE